MGTKEGPLTVVTMVNVNYVKHVQNCQPPNTEQLTKICRLSICKSQENITEIRKDKLSIKLEVINILLQNEYATSKYILDLFNYTALMIAKKSENHTCRCRSNFIEMKNLK